MNALGAVRALLIGDAALALLVDADDVVADDVLPEGTPLPAILIGLVSGVDFNIPAPAGSVFTTKRVQIEIHAASNAQRQDVKHAVRQVLLANPRPAIAAMPGLTLHTEAEGPDFFNADPFVRIGVQDCKLTWCEPIGGAPATATPDGVLDFSDPAQSGLIALFT